MQVKRAVGQGASVIKYDILTALLTLAAHDTGTDGRLGLRLSVLITARYNWRSGHLTVGQREIARLWGVTERTAKRELAQMRAKGWLTVARAAARGRVATLSVELDTVLQSTMPYWSAVGSDFEARMVGAPPQPESNVVPLVPRRTPAQDGTIWSQISARLFDQDPAVHGAWFDCLRLLDQDDTTLTLAAPTGFVAQYVQTHFATRLLAAASAVDPTVRVVKVQVS